VIEVTPQGTIQLPETALPLQAAGPAKVTFCALTPKIDNNVINRKAIFFM
jgi:hypothetical protein